MFSRRRGPGTGDRGPGKAEYAWGIALLFAVLVVADGTARAAAPAPPLVVEANHSTAVSHSDSGIGEVNYAGNVIITYGTTIIKGAHGVVYTQKQHMTKAVVTGSPSHFSYRPDSGLPINGEAAKITWLADQNLVVLEGNATLHRGKEIFHAAVVRYDLDTQLLKARGKHGGRVHVVIPAAGSAGGP